MTDLVVAKFGGTSVADFDAMNRSVDVALLDANTRVVVLSASAGVTNLLVALAEGLEPGERFAKLDAMRQIQFNILERLRYPNVIRDEIERLLENITTLAEAASLASSSALPKGPLLAALACMPMSNPPTVASTVAIYAALSVRWSPAIVWSGGQAKAKLTASTSKASSRPCMNGPPY